MTKELKAVAKYAPRIKQTKTAGTNQLIKYIAGRSGLNQGTISNVLIELREAILFFCHTGQAVKLEGLGTFTPKMLLDGTIKVVHLSDKWLKGRLNDSDHEFAGDIVNKENIGKTVSDLVDQWNNDHPDDPIKKNKK